MKHFSDEEWMSYINDTLSETTWEKIEDHLYLCDQCLEDYMKMINSKAEKLPAIEGSKFTDGIVTKLPKKKVQKSYQRSLIHYGVAAVITLTLMTTGLFQSITGIASTVEASTISKSEESVSNNLMERALSLFEIIGVKQKEGQ
jgi:hypothetical protein